MVNNNIPYDGFANVVEMLKVSDPAFREKILRNIAQRDRNLAERILNALRSDNRRQENTGYDDSVERLERSQRAHHTKNYGM